jgi:hypothetical protein
MSTPAEIPKLKPAKELWREYQKAKRECDQQRETLRVLGEKAHWTVKPKYEYLQAQLSVWATIWQ